MDIWSFQIRLTRRLLAWAGASAVLGVLMLVPADSFWRGLGVQFLAWGLVDAAIAWLGRHRAYARQARLSSEYGAEIDESHRLARLLWLNAGLDGLYVLGGVLLAYRPGASDPFWLGGGLGIVVQGAFLFLFDWSHARRLA